MSIEYNVNDLTEDHEEKIDKYLKNIKKKNEIDKDAKGINNYMTIEETYLKEDEDGDIEEVEENTMLVPFIFGIKTFGFNNDHLYFSRADIDLKRNNEGNIIYKENREMYYDRQKPLIRKTRRYLDKYRATTLNVRTGCGKTAMAIYLSSIYKLLTCILIHDDKVLTPQWYDGYGIWTDCNIWVIELDGKKEYEIPLEVDVIICLWTRVSKIPEEIRNSIGLLIIDECDVFCNKDGLRSILKFNPKYILALTASYERKQDGMHCIMDSFVGTKRVTSTEVFEFDFYGINTEISGKRIKNKMRGRKGCDWAVLSKSILLNNERDIFIYNLCEDLIINKNKKIIVITGLVEHAKQLSDTISELFKENDLEYTSDYLTGKKKPIIDDEGVKHYYQDCDVLVGNYHKIGRGFDEKNFCPSFNNIRINVIILVCSFKEKRLLQQCIGRAFRARCPEVYHLIDDDPTIERHWKSARPWYKKNGGTLCFYEAG